MALPRLQKKSSNGNSPHKISSMGQLRLFGESTSSLPQVPLQEAREGRLIHQGASQITPIKEAQIKGTVMVRLTQRKFKEYIPRIFVYDIFSGDGVNIVDGTSVLGSPVEIANAILESKILQTKRVKFIASDIREEAVVRLYNRLDVFIEQGVDIECVNVDAATMFCSIYERLLYDKACHIIIVVDPNGPAPLPFNELLAVSQDFNKRVDVFLNVSETAMKRVLNCSITRDKNWWRGYDDFKSMVLDVFKNFKQAWVREVIDGDRQRWRYLCFWSFAPTKRGWEKQGLYPINSANQMEVFLEGIENARV